MASSEPGVMVASRASGTSLGVEQTSRWLAERDLLRGGARRAIEIDWKVCGEQEESKYPEIRIGRIDDSTWRKAKDIKL
jgi:hypothetical protein